MSDHRPARVVDFGSHFYAPVLEERLEEHRAIEAFVGNPVCTDVDALREQYAAAGVDAAVLSQPYHIGSSNVERVREANDALLDTVERYDDLYGLAALPVAAGGETAAREFERALEAGYNGAAVETRSGSVEFPGEELDPVFEVADRTGGPLLVHPTLHDSLGEGALDDRWRHNSIFGREVALARGISRAIHEGVYDRYPDLTLVYHHLGGNIAAMLGRVEGALDRAHRSGADHLKTYGEFERVLETRVYVDTSGFYADVDQFRGTLESLPATQVLFGTDFPYETVHPETFREIAGAVESVRGGAERDAILGGNALDVLVNVD